MTRTEVDHLIAQPWHGLPHSAAIYLDGTGRQQPLPFGPLKMVRTAYIYLNADASLLVNGRELKMLAGYDGYWEFLVNSRVSSLAVWTDRIPAQGRYTVVGST